MSVKTQNNKDDSSIFQRRFKRALYAFAIVEFLVTVFAIYYKVRH